MRVLTMVAVLILGGGWGQAAQSTSLTTVEPHGSQTVEKRANAWKEVGAEKRKIIESYLMRELGFSSTAHTQLLGVYRHEQQNESSEAGLLLHIQQLDLMGARLFWSVLVDPDAMSVRVLYHVDASKVSTTFVPIADPAL